MNPAQDAALTLAYIIWLTPRPNRLRAAVHAATYAFEQTGSMGDAAITYAAYGLPIFPVDPKAKRPIPRRDPDLTGTYPKGIPGTGGFYKATVDPKIIERWWRANPHALIGLPMGARTGVWALDVDTSEDHADGVAGWNKIIAEHERIITREHRSATGGPHLIFNWHAARPFGNSAGELPDGIEVKGQGGYIVVPPSRRKGRVYTVHDNNDPIDAPSWLINLISPPRSAAPYNGRAALDLSAQATTDPDYLADIMAFVPNDNLNWDKWTEHALALFAASNGQAFDLFDEFSRKSSKYDASETVERWNEIKSSPPNRTGIGKLEKIARANGWVPKPRFVEPTYPADRIYLVHDARCLAHSDIHNFFETAFDKSDSGHNNVLSEFNEFLRCSTAHALCLPTGLGKTQIAIAELAKRIRAGSVEGPVIYAVPRHKLGHEIEKQFTAHGIDARIFRGRDAIDPDDPEKKRGMCLNPSAVALAMKLHASVNTSCCKSGKMKCQFFDRCGYQRQQAGDKPQVWIVASDMLFHSHKVFGDPAAVIVDEAIWTKGLRGIEREKGGMEWQVALDSLIHRAPETLGGDTVSLRNRLRHRLGVALQAQPLNGGVEARFVTALDVEDCDAAIRLEWESMPKAVLLPGMPDADLKKIARNRDLIDAIHHGRRIIKIWQAVRDLVDDSDIEVSGRLTLRQRNGQRCVEWRGVESIAKKFQVPTLLLDATLPDRSILQVYHPMVQVVANLKVAHPSGVQVRQIVDAPTSSTKLGSERHLNAIKRYILQRWIETGRQRSLIICQEKAEKYLKVDLPENISIEHFNNIAGLDGYKDVRLLILAGRTAPGPQAMEALAAALSGEQPVQATAGPRGFVWFDRVKRGIRLADGSGIGTDGDLHPDPMAEAIRWQVHEGELVQALGRARSINRTQATPLDIDLLFDAALPITVNEVWGWKSPSLLIETARDGVMLTSPVDMVRLWPALWPTVKVADATLKSGMPVLPGFTAVNYQLAGPKMKRRLAYFDRTIIPDPAAWLQERLGLLACLDDGGEGL